MLIASPSRCPAGSVSRSFFLCNQPPASSREADCLAVEISHSKDASLMNQEMFTDKKDHAEMVALLHEWTNDPGRVKVAFLGLVEKLVRKENISLSFNPRPGISYSLRAYVRENGHKGHVLFALMDIVDDDPEKKWLSVCFYGGTVTDPGDKGNLIPAGILGEDGYCFDLYEYDETLISYLKQRIDEAYKSRAVSQSFI